MLPLTPVSSGTPDRTPGNPSRHPVTINCMAKLTAWHRPMLVVRRRIGQCPNPAPLHHPRPPAANAKPASS
jgi:hypothetical protein